jgi:hypothetical protein
MVVLTNYFAHFSHKLSGHSFGLRQITLFIWRNFTVPGTPQRLIGVPGKSSRLFDGLVLSFFISCLGIINNIAVIHSGHL